jgi:hypothetical protein
VGQVQERLDAIEMLEEGLSSTDVNFSFHVVDAIAALLGCRAAAVLLPSVEDAVIQQEIDDSSGILIPDSLLQVVA